MPEWLKGADCKSAAVTATLVRIQPPPPSLKRLSTFRKLAEAVAGTPFCAEVDVLGLSTNLLGGLCWMCAESVDVGNPGMAPRDGEASEGCPGVMEF